MTHDKNHRANTELRKDGSSHEDPGEKGLRILAKMIVRAYLNDVALERQRQRQIMLEKKPKIYVDAIHIMAGSKDINDQKERHKIHAILDEALYLITSSIGDVKSPLIFGKDDISIKIKFTV